MNKADFEGRILLKQNSEMASKLHLYRRENQELRQKNEELNLWVQNLSEVFAQMAGAWQNVLNMEEFLYALMKKKSEMKDKTIINKYIGHFKTFGEIVQNLGEKIQNTGHSDKAALDAKEHLTNFVKNYEMFFRQFVETYFKYNQENLKWLETIQKQADLQSITKTLVGKEHDNRQRIKEFQAFTTKFQQGFKSYQAYNQHRLMDGILARKEQEIAELKLINSRQQRRLRMMMDYSPEAINLLIDNADNEQYFECNCGGTQIKYFKVLWEETAKNMLAKSKTTGEGEMIDQEEHDNRQVKREEIQLLQSQKSRLKERNAVLLDKLEKNKLQNRLTEEMVLKSNSYLLLKEQCQNLVNYANDLMGRLRKQAEFLQELQRNKDEEMNEFKKKIEKQYAIQSTSNLTNSKSINDNQFKKPVQQFKTEITKMIEDLKKTYSELKEKENKNQQNLTKTKATLQSLRKDNEDMNRRLDEYSKVESSKADKFQFRHQRFKDIETKIAALLQKEVVEEQFLTLWNEFISYVKGRDKKIKQLESTLRKKDRQISQKEKIQELIKEELSQTEKIFNNNKTKLDRFEEFVAKVEKELLQLSEDNFQLRNFYEQEKVAADLKVKTETQARTRIQQKLKAYQKIEEQIEDLKRNEDQIQKKSSDWMTDRNTKIDKVEIQSKQKSFRISILIQQSAEKDKAITRLNSQKEALKSQISQAHKRLNAIHDHSGNDDINRELLYYKNRVMCVCTGDRERQVVLKTCPHMFCRKCIDKATDTRNRKCPVCGIKFTKSDIHQLKFT